MPPPGKTPAATSTLAAISRPQLAAPCTAMRGTPGIARVERRRAGFIAPEADGRKRSPCGESRVAIYGQERGRPEYAGNRHRPPDDARDLGWGTRHPAATAAGGCPARTRVGATRRPPPESRSRPSRVRPAGTAEGHLVLRRLSRPDAGEGMARQTAGLAPAGRALKTLPRNLPGRKPRPTADPTGKGLRPGRTRGRAEPARPAGAKPFTRPRRPKTPLPSGTAEYRVQFHLPPGDTMNSRTIRQATSPGRQPADQGRG
jgi:hypothetical protein